MSRSRSLLLATAVIGVLGGACLTRQVAQPLPTDGLITKVGPEGIKIASASADSGFQIEDRLLAIDGHPIGQPLDRMLMLRSSSPGSSLEYVVERDGGTVVVLTHVRRGRPSLEYLLLALIGISCLATAFRLSQRAVMPGAASAAAAALAFAGVLLFSPIGWMDSADRLAIALDELSRLLFPALLLHAVLTLNKLRSRATALLYLPALILALANAAYFGFAGRSTPEFISVAGDLLTRASHYQLALMVAMAAVVAGRGFVAARGAERRRQRWLLGGVVLGIGPYVLAVALPRLIGWESLLLGRLSLLPMILVPFALGNAFVGRALRYDVLLRRGLGFTLSVLLTAGTALAASAVAAAAVSALALPAWPVYMVVALVVSAGSFSRIRSTLTHEVDAALDREGYQARRSLVAFGRELATCTRESDVLDALISRLGAAFRPEAIAVYAAEGPALLLHTLRPAALVLPREMTPSDLDRLSRGNEEVVDWSSDGDAVTGVDTPFEEAIAIRSRGRLLAAVLIGSMPRGRLNREDRRLLADLAGYAAIALDNAQLTRELRRNTRSLRELEQFRANVLETLPIGLLIVDLQGRVLSVNQSFRKLAGGQPITIGGHAASILDPVFLDPPAEHQTVQREHGQRTLSIGSSLLRRSDASVLARIIVCEDITARVSEERERARREKLASVGLLSAGIAHEINTPLAGIAGYVQMLLGTTSDEDTRKPLLRKIEKQSFRAARLVRHLLNFSRPSGSATVPLSLNFATEEAVALLEYEASRRRVRIALSLGRDLLELKGREGEMEQVALNLVKNAIEASGDGGEVRVSTLMAGSTARLVVEDDGHGIPPSDLERIFDPFFTTKHKGSGHGLGLAVSYGIVRHLGGDIQVISKPGAGTRIEVELPISEVAPISVRSAAASGQPPTRA